VSNLYLGLQQGLARLRRRNGAWAADVTLETGPIASIAVDPLKPELVYACAMRNGLWRSEDAGATWRQVGDGITRPIVTVADVSRAERSGGHGAVYVGTRLSALFRSEDGGRTFRECPAFLEIESRPRWSFPPEPDTHHVRSLLADPSQAGLVLAGIELGGVVRSTDDGATWEDQKPNADLDPHTLIGHLAAPRRVYIGGGAGYSESFDGGATWRRFHDGLGHCYCFDLVVDPGDPGTMVISAGNDPFTGHGVPGFGRAWSTLYRREQEGPWAEITDGLPERDGTAMGLLAASADEPGAFVYVTVPGELYQSNDRGVHWERMPVEWPAATDRRQVQDAIGAPG